MTSCTIIISHYESLPFLRACVRQIKKYAHPEIEQRIIVADQSQKEGTWWEIVKEYGRESEVALFNIQPFYSGYGIDYLMRYGYIETDYVCQIHVDAYPVSKNWLYLPIKLIEEYNLSFVGQLQFINSKENLASIYPPNPFFAMAQCFNVAKTETYKEMSLEAGFTRFHNRIDSGLEFEDSEWADWAQADYFKRGSDDDVVAFHWEDTHREHDKLGLAITGFISPAYGRIIDDIVFHFCSARESIGTGNAMGEEYKRLTERINENYSDELIEEMVNLAKTNTPAQTQILTRNLWDGKLKECVPIPDELNKRIEELKNITSK